MIKTEKEYNAIIDRIEELLSNPENIENQEAKGYVELNLLSDMVADYEEKVFPTRQVLTKKTNNHENTELR